MKISGQHQLKAPVEKAWKALTDPAILQKATPGCERLHPVGPDEFEATLRLSEKDGGTLVTYEGDAQIGGAIASVGQRLLEGATRMVLSQFFKNLEKELGRKKEAKS